MLSETLSAGNHSALPPKSGAALSLLQALLQFIGRYFYPASGPEKPDWANCPDRTWQRHSAYLTSLHEQRGGDTR